MIGIGVTDSRAFLRQGQQLRGERVLVRGVCRAFNTIIIDSRHDCATDRKHASKEESITPARDATVGEQLFNVAPFMYCEIRDVCFVSLISNISLFGIR